MAVVFRPKTLPLFELVRERNSVLIGQNIQNKLSVEKSIFADVIAYQLISLNGKLNDREENMHHSFDETDESFICHITSGFFPYKLSYRLAYKWSSN